MAKVEMNIHRALGELKLYDSKINKISQDTFITCKKKSADKVDGIDLVDVEKSIQSSMDKLKALIENKAKLKSAIVISNANTMVTINNIQYTVAEAIERKNNLATEESVLFTLKKQYTSTVKYVNDINERIEDNLETYLSTVLGDGEKSKRDPDLVKSHTLQYFELKEWELVNPAEVQNVIKSMELDIENFRTEVDYVLSESNATTMITVDFTD